MSIFSSLYLQASFKAFDTRWPRSRSARTKSVLALLSSLLTRMTTRDVCSFLSLEMRFKEASIFGSGPKRKNGTDNRLQPDDVVSTVVGPASSGHAQARLRRFAFMASPP